MFWRRILVVFVVIAGFFPGAIKAQSGKSTEPGIITGNIVDAKGNAIAGATIELLRLPDTLLKKGSISDKDGGFTLTNLPFGVYRLRITSIGFSPFLLDSINIRTERYDFNLNDLQLKTGNDALKEVVVYAEKPLIQSKEGNITFNASESALSAGSNASDLLKNVPLVASDPNGKLTVRGKEPKILIDDKPVELNAQQLQDFLESMPGSMIERVEVMTNPPPQYANEPGGVINIVTRKGKVGRTGRLNISGGTRGEAGISGNLNFRKKGFSLNINAGMGYNEYEGYGYSRRKNIYTDSSNYFNTDNEYRNINRRPNIRVSMDYEFDPRNAINAVVSYNQNDFDNKSTTTYTNLDRFESVYRLSKRAIQSLGTGINPSGTVTYTHRGKKPGETLRVIGSFNISKNQNDRYFYQQFFNPDLTPNGQDSTQQQFTDNNSSGYNLRVAYDKLLSNNKTSFSTGGFYSFNTSHVVLLSEYLRKSDGQYIKSDILSNDFRFRQAVNNLRFSLRHSFEKGTSISGGINAEQTHIYFDLYQTKQKADNSYWTFLPFFNFNRQWQEKWNMTFAYRRTLRRPGMGELNPTIDYGDPYNLRFGNKDLLPSTSHNLDLVFGRTHDKFYLNMGLGYNIVQDVYAQIRTLQPDGKTHVTWQNIDDRLEYETSMWSGITFSKKMRVNFSASYTYNRYSAFDRNTYRYRNGGSFTSNLNGNYTPKDVWNFNGSFTFNRFANPQGFVRWNTSMNLGIQRKFFQKRFIVTVNLIDPIQQQKNRTLTYGTNFNHESFSFTQTRNYRLTLTYNFISPPKKVDLKKIGK